MTGRLRDLMMGRDGTQILSLSLNADFREAFDSMRDKDLTIEIKPFRKGRSLEANNYAWTLIDKIAEKLQTIDPDGGWTPEKVYLDTIKDLGGVSQILGMKTVAVEYFRRSWTAKHLGRRVDVIDGSSKEGWSNVRVVYGTSDYDTAQMSRFINILVQQAESLGIPTITEAEAEKMLGRWSKKHDAEHHAE